MCSVSTERFDTQKISVPLDSLLLRSKGNNKKNYYEALIGIVSNLNKFERNAK